MRRLMLLMVGLSFFSVLSGCKNHPCTTGVCDCEQADHCASRSPWVRMGMSEVTPEAIPAPAKEMPPAPKGL